MELRLDKINKSFGENHVLKDVSFTARSGVATGLLGRNGSGKTTTIRIIMNIFPPNSGTATIDGKPSKEFTKRIGFLPEERGLYPKRKISDQIAYLGELRGMRAKDARERGKKLLERLEAGEYFDKTLDTLSKGNQQKIQLAIALLNDPEIVILDEPFSGLDPVNAKILKDLVRDLVDEGRLVLFSSHQMGYVEAFCDDVVMINGGEIVMSGRLRDIKKSYPRDRVLLVPEEGDANKLRNQLADREALKDIITDVSEAKDGFRINLTSPEAKNRLFERVAGSGVELDTFQVVEPSLEEIFVEKAGGENEAV